MPRKSISMDYTKEEVEQRLVAALRGVRIARHQPMEGLTQKKVNRIIAGPRMGKDWRRQNLC